ncbi:hypothetical protein U5801_04915 [Lamprobacter modestohalophilus]|uniref:hypothetical protein n=1 Tax=Lamprobacter modestohalophilus TaxID=1064514 RepID=UPI002ADEEB37|nr:hypothetical protein [Lamprobacter modestohalophilus]MEA1049150.1 hypothetical protein [Lamprobacter modestohalophilus]
MADPEKPSLELTQPASAAAPTAAGSATAAPTAAGSATAAPTATAAGTAHANAVPADAAVSAAAPGRARSGPWYLVTNQLNLMYLLAMGLVTGPKGFGRKYYADTLAWAPGWIPLFADGIPPAALAQVTSEADHLQPVIASVDLGALRGPIQTLDPQGRLRALQWPEEAQGDETLLFIPAPLPIGWLQAIIFASKEQKALIREQAADYANVPLGAYKQRVNARLFAAASKSASASLSALILPEPIDRLSLPLPDQDASVQQVSAVGAVQAMLVGLGNRGDALVTAGQSLSDPELPKPELPEPGLTDPEATATQSVEDPLLRALLAWAQGENSAANADLHGRILARLLSAIVDAKTQADEAPAGEGCPPDIQQVILDLLEAERTRLAEPKWQEALKRLIADLKGCLGLGDATISELFQRHQKPFSRGLLLFFLRQRSQELLELSERFDQPLLTDQDLVVAAALFGARGGWLELPGSIKDLPGLSSAISHRMAALSHRQRATGIDLGLAPARVEPLRELMTRKGGGGGWSKRQQEGALALARGMGWQEVLKTRISLGKGDYRLQVAGNGVQLLLDGEVKAVTVDVDQARLLELLARTAIPSRIDAEVRKRLRG